MKKLQLSEHFYSIQGEPFSFGNPAYFLRFAGCNLRCEYCDTKYALTSKKSVTLSFDKLLRNLILYNCKLIVITGGEPLLKRQELIELHKFLPSDYIFEIETNGTQDPLTVIERSMRTRLFRYNVSPKLDSSGNSLVSRYHPAILQRFNLGENAIFKFVVKTRRDMNEVDEIVKQLNIAPSSVWIMPEGRTDKEVKKHALQFIEDIKAKKYNLTPRLQIWLYGKKRGV